MAYSSTTVVCDIISYRQVRDSDLHQLLWVTVSRSISKDLALLLGLTPQKLLSLRLHPVTLVIQQLFGLSCALWNVAFKTAD